GTHRAVAMRCGDVPITTLSTGTNNAFPDLREATTAGFATGLLASGRVSRAEATLANKRIVVEACGRCEVALVDVCVTRH
ncbi:ATP-NAD kinase, partial [Citrobacter sp. AAK_AS5]